MYGHMCFYGIVIHRLQRELAGSIIWVPFMGKINMNMCGVCMHKRVLDLFVGYVIKKS